ncbi:MAG: hypothetical protein KY459_15885 [Acidobacteria bacterium]|nr:hypothetical protein [Acidobacteriota bacterium]
MRWLAIILSMPLLVACPDARDADIPPETSTEFAVDAGTVTASPDTTNLQITPQAAVRSYYDAINRRDFATAWRMWDNEGEASGKSLVDFSTGFQGTRNIKLELGEVVTDDLSSVDVPVVVTAEMKAEETRVFAGTYTLRRFETDRTNEWRIVSADLTLVPSSEEPGAFEAFDQQPPRTADE